MFEALVITLREGIEAALVIGIILTCLNRGGRGHLAKAVFAGLGAGVLASLAGAVVVGRLGWSEERYEGWLMLLGAAFVLSMVVWMWRTARGLKRDIEARVASVVDRAGGSGAAAWGLFLLTFVLVLREGLETVLFLATVNLTTDALLSFAGGVFGLLLAAAFGVALVRGAVRVDLGRFFKVTEIVLLVLAAQLFIGGLHELGEAGLLPVGRREMELIGPIVKSEALVFAALLALPLLAVALPGRRDRERRSEADRLEGPDRRLALAALGRETRWRRILALSGVAVIAALTISHAFTRLPAALDPPRLLTFEPDAAGAAGGVIRLPVTGLDDGHLHRFGVALDGTVVRFIVMKTGGRLVATFDACVVCGARGYIERQGRLVCLACAADINTQTLGTGGGCNPIPLRYTEEGGALIITAADLKAEAKTFHADDEVAARRGAAAPADAAPRRAEP
ncbi:MAG TPA: Fe-S-containing protein [Candidatus Polarisedimenticolia bacterium]|nr:Fe-S-containing protein [Candidatus Polarisedimenticolia bacterium]